MTFMEINRCLFGFVLSVLDKAIVLVMAVGGIFFLAAPPFGVGGGRGGGILSVVIVSAPMLGAFFWVAFTESGEALRRRCSNWALRACLLAVLMAWGLYARKWGGDVVNAIFAIEPRYLPTAATLAGWLAFPMAFMNGLWLVVVSAICILLALICFMGVYASLINAHGEPLRVRCREAMNLLGLGLAAIGYWLAATNLSASFPEFITDFAIWADFSERHQCANAHDLGARAVLHIDSDRVLAYVPYGGGIPPKVYTLQCDFGRNTELIVQRSAANH